MLGTRPRHSELRSDWEGWKRRLVALASLLKSLRKRGENWIRKRGHGRNFKDGTIIGGVGKQANRARGRAGISYSCGTVWELLFLGRTLQKNEIWSAERWGEPTFFWDIVGRGKKRIRLRAFLGHSEEVKFSMACFFLVQSMLRSCAELKGVKVWSGDLRQLNIGIASKRECYPCNPLAQ